MKKLNIRIVLALFFVLICQSMQAKILRVGYFANQIPNQDYPDLVTANNAAAPGDTLLVYPGNYNGTYATLNKKLIVIGYGYYVSGNSANANLQAITGALSVSINLSAGSDSTIIEGIDNLAITTATNVTLKGVLITYCNAGLSYDHNTRLVDWKITRSVFNFYTTPFQGYDTFQNLLLENDIITACDLVYTTSSGCTGVFNNNIFTSTPNFNNGGYSLYNNIFLTTTAPKNTANCVFDYNIASNNIIPNTDPYTHNQSNVAISSVFVGYPTQGAYSNDGRYKLAPGSPAIGAGEGGIDCGIFGNLNPYRLSGIPPIPSFYKITAPSNTVTSSPFTITFSVRSNN